MWLPFRSVCGFEPFQYLLPHYFTPYYLPFFFLFPLRPSSPPPTPTWHFSSSAGPGNKAVFASPSLSQVVGRVPARNRQVTIEKATLVQQFSLRSVIIFDYSKLEMMKLWGCQKEVSSEMSWKRYKKEQVLINLCQVDGHGCQLNNRETLPMRPCFQIWLNETPKTNKQTKRSTVFAGLPTLHERRALEG